MFPVEILTSDIQVIVVQILPDWRLGVIGVQSQKDPRVFKIIELPYSWYVKSMFWHFYESQNSLIVTILNINN